MVKLGLTFWGFQTAPISLELGQGRFSRFVTWPWALVPFWFKRAVFSRSDSWRHGRTATSVLRVPIEEFSSKVRTGPPIDDEKDYSFPTWAGVIPLDMRIANAINDPRLDSARAVPEYVRNYSRKKQ